MNINQVKPSELRAEEPYKGLFPHADAMRDAIAEAMARDGFDPAFPIVTRNGVVIDGHTRLAAARKAGLKLVYYVDRQFPDEAAALEYAIRCQRNRRNLTQDELLRCLKELDKRKREGRPAAAETTQDCAVTGRSSEATAELLGVSARKVEQLRTIEDHAPAEVKAAVASGGMSVNAAYEATQTGRGKRKPLPLTPEPDRLEKMIAAWRRSAEGLPRHWWHAIAEAHRACASELDIEATDAPEDVDTAP